MIALGAQSWWSNWMPQHQVLNRLAARFEVVWIEPAQGWRDLWLPGGSAQEAVQGAPPDIPGFTVFDPGRWFPQIYRPHWFGQWLRFQRVRAARRILEKQGCERIVLYLWRPDFDWALDAISADLTCYHIDDEYTFSPVDRPNDPREVALIRRVDQVIVHSRRLMEKKGYFNPQTILVPNGVDYATFATHVPEPTEFAAIPRPRIGYVGVLKTQLDLDLLLDLATRRPDWSMVLVGPRGYLGDKTAKLDRLSALPNVHVLGNRQVSQLPAYMQHLDVCIMCYEVNDYTNFIYPLKLHEYLASGSTVVSAPIDSVLPFSGTVKLASSPDEWERAIEESLFPTASEPENIRRRQSVAAEHDWNKLVSRIAKQFRARLG